MAETAKLLQPGFSTADAEYPDLTLNDGVLRLEFREWTEQVIVVEFDDVCAVRWQEVGYLGPEDREDSVYEIIDSDWLEAHLKGGARDPEEGHRHFKLGFNAYGPLEVLATRMRLVSRESV